MVAPLTMHPVLQLPTIHAIRARVDPLVAMRLLVGVRAPKEVLAPQRRLGREHRVLAVLEHDPVLGVVLLEAAVAVLAGEEVVAVPGVVVLDAVVGVAELGARGAGGAVCEVGVVVPLPAVRGVVELLAGLALVAGVAVEVEVHLVADLAAAVELGAELEGTSNPEGVAGL